MCTYMRGSFRSCVVGLSVACGAAFQENYKQHLNWSLTTHRSTTLRVPSDHRSDKSIGQRESSNSTTLIDPLVIDNFVPAIHIHMAPPSARLAGKRRVQVALLMVKTHLLFSPTHSKINFFVHLNPILKFYCFNSTQSKLLIDRIHRFTIYRTDRFT